MDGAPFVVTLVTAVGYGLVAGVFLAFSAFVSRGLGDLPSRQGIAAMQAINAAAVRPAFMTVLFGTALAGVACMAGSVLNWGEPYTGYLLAAGLLYLVGVIGLTITVHVPLNEALARVDPADTAAAGHWGRYLAGWTGWNHVRTAAALAAAAAQIGAIHVG